MRRDYESSNIFLTYDTDHKWHYLDRQQADEVLIFKQFDTRADVKANCELLLRSYDLCVDTCLGCPHGAFQHGTIRKDAPPRQSIEVRALVMTLPQQIEDATEAGSY